LDTNHILCSGHWNVTPSYATMEGELPCWKRLQCLSPTKYGPRMKHQSQKTAMLDVAEQMLYRGKEVRFQQAPSAGGWEDTSNSSSHTSSWPLIFILPVWNSVNISCHQMLPVKHIKWIMKVTCIFKMLTTVYKEFKTSTSRSSFFWKKKMFQNPRSTKTILLRHQHATY